MRYRLWCLIGAVLLLGMAILPLVSDRGSSGGKGLSEGREDSVLGVSSDSVDLDDPRWVEDVDRRGLCTKTYSSGLVRVLDVSQVPLHYKDDPSDESEPWKDIDTTFVEGEVVRALYTLQIIEAGNPGFRLWVKGEKDPYVVRADKAKVPSPESTVKGIGDVGGVVDKVEVDPVVGTPIYSGNTVTWKNVWSGVDLVIEAHPGYVGMYRILKDDSCPAEYDVSITEPELSAASLRPLEPAVDAVGQLVEMEESVKGGKRTEVVTDTVTKIDGSASIGGVVYPIKDATVIDIQVGALGDAGVIYNHTMTAPYSGGSFSTDWLDVARVSSTQGRSFFNRFTGVTIPQGAVILEASLEHNSYTTLSDTPVNATIAAEDTLNPTAPTNATQYWADWAARTTTTVDWDDIEAHTADYWYYTPDLSPIVQELVNTSAYTNDEILFMVVVDTDTGLGVYRQMKTYFAGASTAPRLRIVYIDVGSTAEITDPAEDYLEFAPSTTIDNPHMVPVAGDVVAVAYEGLGGIGKVDTFQCDDAGELSPAYATWHFNESSGSDASDSGGYGYDGALVNMEDPGDWVAGKLNNCLQFDGVNEYVNFGQIGSFDGDDSFSYECWFQGTGVNEFIMGKGLQSTTTRGIHLMNVGATGQLYLYLANDISVTNEIGVRGNTQINDGSWHHLFATYDGSGAASGVNLYVDGSLENMTTIYDALSGTIVNEADFQVAARDGTNNAVTGKIDEVVVYDRVMSGDYVSRRYNSAAGTEYETTFDTLTYDATSGLTPFMVRYSGTTKYVVFHQGTGSDGFVTTMDIQNNGEIGSAVIDTFEFYTDDLVDPCAVQVDGDVFAVVFEGADSDGYLVTLDINGDGTIDADPVIDTWEFDTADCEYPYIVHLGGTNYAVAYGSTGQGELFTVSIADDGAITESFMDTLTFESGTCTRYNSITHVRGDVYVVAYQRVDDFDGWMASVRIGTDGFISGAVLDTEEFESDVCQSCSAVSVGEGVVVFYMGPDSDGWSSGHTVSDMGIVAAATSTCEFDTDNGEDCHSLRAHQYVYLVAYEGTDDDGWVKSVLVGEGNFGAGDALPDTTVSSCTPDEGDRGDSSLDVVIAGDNLTGATSVDFGTMVSIDSYVVDSDEQITATVTIPWDSTAGLRDVTVVTPSYGSGVLTDGFEVTIPAPTVTSVTPIEGAQAETVNVTIAGTGFIGATDVDFGDGITVDTFTVDSGTQISATLSIASGTPAGTRDVAVTTSGGTGTLVDGFSVETGVTASVELMFLCLIVLAGILSFFAWKLAFLPVSLAAGLAWLALAVLAFIYPEKIAFGDITEGWVAILGAVFLLMAFSVFLLQMKSDVQHEAEVRGQMLRWTTRERPPKVDNSKSSAERQRDYRKRVRKHWRK